MIIVIIDMILAVTSFW